MHKYSQEEDTSLYSSKIFFKCHVTCCSKKLMKINCRLICCNTKELKSGGLNPVDHRQSSLHYRKHLLEVLPQGSSIYQQGSPPSIPVMLYFSFHRPVEFVCITCIIYVFMRCLHLLGRDAVTRFSL